MAGEWSALQALQNPEPASDSEDLSSGSEISRHVLHLQRRLAHLENLIYRLTERLGELEEQCRVAASHFAAAERLAQEATSQAALNRLEVNQLADRVRSCEQSLDLAALD